jgi:fumarate hydratase class II
MARNLLDSIKLLAAASRLLAEKCVDGIEANREQCERYAELTLSAATALNPYIGYDKAPRSSRRPPRRPLAARGRARGGRRRRRLDEALDYRAMARPHNS